MKLYKYTGAGNDFIILDGRGVDLSSYREPSRIAELCDRSCGISREGFRTGSDGLIILGQSREADFSMEFFNPDGSGGMMCGNGGRCIAAFAADLGIRPLNGKSYRFEAPDGMHEAQILRSEGAVKMVRLAMKDVSGLRVFPDGLFLDTGTRHFVRFVPDAEAVDPEVEGPKVRWREDFAPQGTNVNFVSVPGGGPLLIRTFEKGVEGETAACGTGITASALAAFACGIAPETSSVPEGPAPFPGAMRLRYTLRARIASLAVDFVPAAPSPFVQFPGTGFTDIPSFHAVSIHLTGPAEQEYTV